MDEKTFSSKLRKILSTQGIVSMNLQNISSEYGCPDTNLLDTVSGRDGFFELKVLRSGDKRIKFQPGQTEWLHSRETSGGVAGLIVLVLPRKNTQKPVVVCVRGRTARIIERVQVESPEDILKHEKLEKFSCPFPSGEMGRKIRAYMNLHPCAPI